MTYRSETSRKMTDDIILEVFRLEQLGFEEIVSTPPTHQPDSVNNGPQIRLGMGWEGDVRSELTSVHEDGSEHVGAYTPPEGGYTFFADHLYHPTH
jgi:hypothetical protein